MKLIHPLLILRFVIRTKKRKEKEKKKKSTLQNVIKIGHLYNYLFLSMIFRHNVLSFIAIYLSFHLYSNYRMLYYVSNCLLLDIMSYLPSRQLLVESRQIKSQR